MAGVGKVEFEITAQNSDAINKMKETENAIGGIGGKLGSINGLMKSAFAVYAVSQLTDALQDCLKVMAATETAMKGLASVSESYGQSTSKATRYAKELATDGLISITNSAQTLKNLLGAGFDLEEAFNIAKSMKDIGAFNNTVGDLGQAMQDSSKGIKTNSMELIENIGLTSRLSTVMKQNNVDISNGIDLTNNASQRQAVYNSIIAEGARNMGNAAKYAEDYAGKVSKSKAAFRELESSIGGIISGPTGKILDIFSSGAKELKIIIENTTKKTEKQKEEETQVQKLNKEYDALYKTRNSQTLKAYMLDYEIAKSNNSKLSDDKLKYLDNYYTRLMNYEKEATEYNKQNQNVTFSKRLPLLMSNVPEQVAATTQQQDINKQIAQIEKRDAAITKSSDIEKKAKDEMLKATEKVTKERETEIKYFADLNKKISDTIKLDEILGKTVEDIQSDKIKIVSTEIEKLAEKGDITSKRFMKLVETLKEFDSFDGDFKPIQIEFESNKNLIPTKDQKEIKYFTDLNKKISDAIKLDEALGKTVEDIQSDKIKIVSFEIENLSKKGDMASERFMKLVELLKELDSVNEMLKPIQIEFEPSENLTGSIKGQHEDIGAERFNPKQPVDLITEANMKKTKEEKQYFDELETKIKNVEAVGKVLEKSFEEINQSKFSIIGGEIESLGKAGDVSSEKFEQLGKMWNDLVQEINNSKMTVRIESSAQYIHPPTNVYNKIPNNYVADEYDPFQYEDFSDIPLSGSGSSGIDYGSYYGQMGFNGALGTHTAIKPESSSDTYSDEQEAYYKKLEERVKAVNEAVGELGSNMERFGEAIGSDFISALGKAIDGIGDFKKYASQIQAGRETGGATGAFGMISGAVGIAGTAMSIGTTIFNALNPAAEKQKSAAEMMATAVQDFKDSIKDNTVQEINVRGTDLAKQIEDKKIYLSGLEDSLAAAELEDSLAAAERVSTRAGLVVAVEIKDTKNQIKTLEAELAVIKPAIIDALKITWQDLASGVSSAFNASNLNDFYSSFEKSLTEAIRNSLITSFLQSEAIKLKFTSLSESIYSALESVGFDSSKITDEQVAAWKLQVEGLSQAGGEFYSILDAVGLGVEKLGDAANSATAALKNLPGGIKVAAYRFSASQVQLPKYIEKIKPTAEYIKNSNLSTDKIAKVPNVKLDIESQNKTVVPQTVNMTINGTNLNPIQLKTAVIGALEAINNARVG